MKNCKLTRKNLIDFIDGNVSESLDEIIKRHIDDCDQCRRLYIRIKAVYSSVEETSDVKLSPGFYPGLQSRIDQYEEEHISLVEIWQYFTSKTRPVLTSLTLIIAIMAGYLLGHGAFANGYAEYYSDEEYLTRYYGIDQFELSTELALSEVYYQLLNEEVENE